jgi:DNA-directed RNA polymerase subunit RPC12/RpoP
MDKNKGFIITCEKCGSKTLLRQKDKNDIDKSNNLNSIYSLPEGGYVLECKCGNEVTKFD